MALYFIRRKIVRIIVNITISFLIFLGSAGLYAQEDPSRANTGEDSVDTKSTQDTSETDTNSSATNSSTSGEGEASQTPADDEIKDNAGQISGLPFKESSASDGASVFWSYVTIAVVLGVLVAALIVVRRKLLFVGPGMDKGYIKVIERKRLGMQSWTTLLEVKGEEILVIEANNALSVKHLGSASSKNVTGSD